MKRAYLKASVKAAIMCRLKKIRSRLQRTMMHIATALPLVDEDWLLDNSSHDEPFKQVALIRKGKRIKTIDSLPVWAKQILEHIPENRF